MYITKAASQLPLFCMWWWILGWGEAGDECNHVISSTIPPPLAHTAFIFVCGAKWTSAHLPLQRMADRTASPQNRLCRETAQNRSAINYSLSEIFISQSYLQTLLTITRILHCNGDPQIMFWIHFILIFSTWTYSVHIPLHSWLFTADCCFFFHLFWLSCPYGRVVFPCVPEIFLSTYSLMLNNCIFWFAITFSPTKCIPVGRYYFNVDHTSMADPIIDVWWGSFSKVLVTLTVWSLVFSAATLIQGDSITTT